MIVVLQLDDVDKVVDLVLSKTKNVHFRRQELKKPERIIYTGNFKDLKPSAKWVISIRGFRRETDVDFPISFPPFDVVPTPDGGRIEIWEGWGIRGAKLPEYEDPFDKALYEVCCSVWSELKLSEGILTGEIKQRNNKKSGRPHFPDDVWAWEEVNKHERASADVYLEWMAREGVLARNLVDPENQFKRIIRRSWGINMK